MPMVPFFTRFRELAVAEMRTAIVRGRPGLPDGEYGFLELFCNEPDCDCRRVIIQVIRPDSGTKVWATLNYGWESPAYYRTWIHDRAEARRCAGVWLDPLNAQTQHAPALLELLRLVLGDAGHIQRLKRHYQLFKAAIQAQQKPPGGHEPEPSS